MRAWLLLPILLAGAGCGHIAHQTRYIPRASQLSWESEHKQLPWRPPSVDEHRYPYHRKPQNPRAQHQAHYRMDHHVVGFHYIGDGDAADLASDMSHSDLEPLD